MKEIDQLKQEEVLAYKIRALKSQEDPSYGDVFNQLVCQQLDNLLSETPKARLMEKIGEGGAKVNFLKWSEKILIEQMKTAIDENDYEKFGKYLQEQEKQRLSTEADSFIRSFLDEKQQDPNKISSFISLWVSINVGQPFPFKEKYARKELLSQIARSLFNGEDFTLVSLICMSFVHQPQSLPGTVRVSDGTIEKKRGRDNDDIEALENFSRSVDMLKKSLGKRVKAYAILSDIDFIEVFRVTDTNALEGASIYYRKFQKICGQKDLIPLSFIDVLQKNPEAKRLYNLAKADIAENIEVAKTSNRVKDPRFYYTLYFVNGLTQSIYDYYNSLPGITMSWTTAYQNTIDKLLLYGSQPEVLRSLFPQGFTFISSESPIRDAMYMRRDKVSGKKRMVIIYPFC